MEFITIALTFLAPSGKSTSEETVKGFTTDKVKMETDDKKVSPLRRQKKKWKRKRKTHDGMNGVAL